MRVKGPKGIALWTFLRPPEVHWSEVRGSTQLVGVFQQMGLPKMADGCWWLKGCRTLSNYRGHCRAASQNKKYPKMLVIQPLHTYTCMAMSTLVETIPLARANGCEWEISMMRSWQQQRWQRGPASKLQWLCFKQKLEHYNVQPTVESILLSCWNNVAL